MKRNIKIGFLGSGYVTSLHIDALKKIPTAQITAVTSLDPKSAELVAQPLGAAVYSDYKTMLKKENLDAVYICIPPGAHQGQELDIACRGIPMLIEKPVALDMAYAQKIQQALQDHNTFAVCGYHFRYMDLVARAQTLLKNRNIVMCRCRYSAGMPGVAWWARRNSGGGQLIEQSTHLLDLMRMFLGEVIQIQSVATYGAMKSRKEYDVEDASLVNLQFASGAIAHIQSDCIYPCDSVVEMEFAADRFRLTISFSKNQITVVTPDGTVIEHYQGFAYESGFLKENQAFVKAVQTGRTDGIKATYQEGVKTLGLSLDIVAKF